VARAVDLSVIQGVLHPPQEYSSYEAQKMVDATTSEKPRADIIDRHGVILARSLKTSSLFADAALVRDPQDVAKDLKKVFPDISYGATLKKLQSKKRFVWLKRNITPDQQSQILYLGHPGLDFKSEMKRVYPQGSLAVHSVGVSGVDGQGLVGIERGFDNLLQGGGAPLQLTLDVRLQHALRRELSATMKSFKGKGAAGVVMDTQTGEVLAAVSLPDYKPQGYQKANSDSQFNRYSQGVYELGSVFKVFSTAAILEKRGGRISQNFDVREPIKIGRFKIRDYHPENRVLTLPEVFIHSSNIGSAMMGQAVGTEELKNFYKDLGLLSAPEFGVSEIGKPLIPSPWNEVHTMTASYGHGIAVSPLQLVSATSSLLNGGILVKPKIVKSIGEESKDGVIRVVSPETSHRMRQLMRLAVTQGTGGNADVEGYLVGGKTGSAEKSGRGGYDRKKLISSFLGAFPMNDPRYVVFAMVDEPVGSKETYGYATGGWVGAPTVGRIVSSMVSILGISPINEEEKFEKSLMHYVKTKEQLKKEQKLASH
jgi:cell division protein FtsI (penicillin-binding protein 3)